MKPMAAIFIDGPLSGETKMINGAPLQYIVPLMESTTYCDCNPEREYEFETPARRFTYNRIMLGDSVVMYSEHKDDSQVLSSLKNWMVTDLLKPSHHHCRSRRAFT